jgi:hypothetical protein
MYNYGHLQVLFDDGSVGWYGGGLGPMISKRLVKDDLAEWMRLDRHGRGRQVRRHRHAYQTSCIRLHRSATGKDGTTRDAMLSMQANPTIRSFAT